jgi:curli biogenesis system outer membrane secretion channel CsgG
MKFRKTAALWMALFFLAANVASVVTGNLPQALASTKRRIAILPFEYGAVSSSVGTYDVGKGIVSLLTTKLVNDGTYSVVDRQMLDSILKEQNLSVSDRADPATACKIGKILSVDAIMVGTVTQFGFETKTVSAGNLPTAYIPGIPYVGGIGGLMSGMRSSKSKVKVAIDARIIDINTSEILAVVHGTGESKRSSGGALGLVDVDSSDFSSSIAGEATLQAVDEMGGQLIAAANKIPDNQSIAQANVEGKIADVTGGQITVNVGKVNGLAVGDKLQVMRAFKTITDPDTGKVLKTLSNTIAVLNLDAVDKDSATGSVVKGSGAKVGDTVKKVTMDVSAIVVAPVPGADPGSIGHSMSATGAIITKGAKSVLRDAVKSVTSSGSGTTK